MFIVLKKNSGPRSIGIDSDGTEHTDLHQTELFSRANDAQAVAERVGGRVEDEDRICGRYDDDDLDL